MNMSDLASAMLEWERRQREADTLKAEIEAAVLGLGKTQTVGNVRATYSAGRKSYDYFAAFDAAYNAAHAMTAGWERTDLLARYNALRDKHSTIKWDYCSICKEAEIEAEFTQSEPSVTVKLLD